MSWSTRRSCYCLLATIQQPLRSTWGWYQILRHPDVIGKFEDELLQAFPGKQTLLYHDLRQLPFFVSYLVLAMQKLRPTDNFKKCATIKEVLRYSSPLPGRLPRVVPTEGYKLNGIRVRTGVSTQNTSEPCYSSIGS